MGLGKMEFNNVRNERMSKMDLIEAYEQVKSFIKYLDSEIEENKEKEE